MGLFIASDQAGTNFIVDQVQVDIISITKTDIDLGFDEANPVALDGANCIPVTYTNLNETGPTPQRIFDLVTSNGFVSPPHIVIIGVNDSFVLSDGTPMKGNGRAMQVGEAGNPLANHITAVYDVTQCGGLGVWFDKQGGGTVQGSSDVTLYHELSHCFHFVTGTLPVDAAGNTDFPQEEVNAEIDENDMRDVRGFAHRDVNSHNGGCGGGTTSCCIVASLSTGSPYSNEVNRLRYMRDLILRRSEAGDDFFEKLHYYYYAFSPEVTHLLANFPELKEATKLSFVTPLIMSLELLIHYSKTKGKNLYPFIKNQYAQYHLHEQFNADTLKLLLSYINRFENKEYANVQKGVHAELGIEGFNELMKYINSSVLENEYIKWALIGTVQIWMESILIMLENNSQGEQLIYDKLSAWICKFPVTDIWGNFSRLQMQRELDNLEHYIFDKEGKKEFAQRLMAKHAAHRTTINEWSNN